MNIIIIIIFIIIVVVIIIVVIIILSVYLLLPNPCLTFLVAIAYSLVELSASGLTLV